MVKIKKHNKVKDEELCKNFKSIDIIIDPLGKGLLNCSVFVIVPPKTNNYKSKERELS